MVFRNGRSNLLLPVSKTLQFDKLLRHAERFRQLIDRAVWVLAQQIIW